MTAFVEMPASKHSIQRKLVHGHGVNDVSYIIARTVAGKYLICPYYQCWRTLLERAYSKKWHKRYPTYIGCSVSEEWLIFSNFRKWMELQNWQGMDLDKDIKIKGNRVYSAETCLFIPNSLNKLLCDRAAKRGDYPIGVYKHKGNRKNPFKAQVTIAGKKKAIGYFPTPELANAAYVKEKNKEIERQAILYPQWAKYILQHKLLE